MGKRVYLTSGSQTRPGLKRPTFARVLKVFIFLVCPTCEGQAS